MPSPTRPNLPWEPEALELPLERPVPRTPRWRAPELDDEDARRDGGAGSHVIVIDLA